MSLRTIRRLEKLELARVRRLRVYWVDVETGVWELIAGGEEGGEVGAGRGLAALSKRSLPAVAAR